jgi:hypothetical protein
VKTLRIIKQGPTELFFTFFSYFEKALANAERMTWPNKIKRLYLDGALIFKLRRLIIIIPFIAVYGAYISEILYISDLYRSAIKHAFKKHLMTR